MQTTTTNSWSGDRRGSAVEAASDLIALLEGWRDTHSEERVAITAGVHHWPETTGLLVPRRRDTWRASLTVETLPPPP